MQLNAPATATATKTVSIAGKTRAPDLDEETLRRAGQGDDEAFRAVVHRYYRPALAIALKVVRDPNDAMDVVQDAFVRIFRNLPAFRGSSNFYTWMHRIVMNVSIDHVRRVSRAQKVYSDQVFEDDRAEGLREDPIAPSMMDANPRRTVLRYELVDHIRGAFTELSDDHRRILVLREVDGLSYEEISAALDIPKGTVMSRLYHARQRMQLLLGDYVEGELNVAG